MYKKYGKNQGFTLVEILVAIAIVGILAAVAIPMYNIQQDKAHHTAAIADGKAVLSSVVTALIPYTSYGSSGSVTLSGSTLTISMMGPTPSTPNSVTTTVNVTPGTTISSSGVSGTSFCITLSNTGQKAVYTQNGYQSTMINCTSTGVADTTLRTNLITNPSVEVDTTGWLAVAATLARTTTETYAGTASLQVSVTGFGGRAATVTQLATAAPNTAYTASAWVKAAAGTTVQIWLNQRAPGDIFSNSSFTATGSWQRITKTVTTSPTVQYINVYVGAQTAGNVVYVDAVQLEVGSTATDYFDGSNSGYGDIAYAWTGTSNASVSIEKKV